MEKLVHGSRKTVWIAENYFSSWIVRYRHCMCLGQNNENEKFIYNDISMGTYKKNIFGFTIGGRWEIFGHTRVKEFIK